MSRAAPALAAAALLLAQPARVGADDATAAAAMYQQAEALAKAGKWAEACPVYEASYKADAQIGVLLHLADCHEHVGRVASAAAEFTDAAELAHRKGDTREAYAQGRAAALAPRLAHLHLAPPAAIAPGLAVFRDGTDVTALVGTDLPIDPGEHDVRATAPGYHEWRTHVTIGVLPTTTTLAIPALEPAPVDAGSATPPPAEARPGTLRVTSRADAHILLDGTDVGTGSFAGPVKAGGHTLRITAPGMRAYTGEVVVTANETRTVPIELDPELPVAAPAGPRFELGAAIEPGVKLHGDRPIVLAYRAELGLGAGDRVRYGLYFEAATIDAHSGHGACGSNLAGNLPASPFDFGARDQFTRCAYLLPGIQLQVHLRPGARVDPFVALAPGFRIGFMAWTPYTADGMPGSPRNEKWPGIVIDARVGLALQPTHARSWRLGALVSAEVTAYGQEDDNGGNTYVSLFAGLRSTLEL